MKKPLAVFAAVIASCVIALPGASMATEADSPAGEHKIGDVTVRTEKPITTESELEEFLLSSTPKTGEIDIDTGKLTTIVEDSVLQPPAPEHKIGDVTVRTEKPITSQAELDEFLLSSTPKTGEIDIDTGKLTTIVEDSVLQPKP
jgi:hypothetical protein